MPEPQVSELMVRGIVVGVFAENCWIIGSRRTTEAIVIDPGDQPEEILALARDMGLNIKLIANSHGHLDHVLGIRGVQEATVGGVKLTLLHTPGHTPGSLSFYGAGLLFSGDPLFRGSIGRADLPGGDYAQERSSIVGRAAGLPGPGGGRPRPP